MSLSSSYSVCFWLLFFCWFNSDIVFPNRSVQFKFKFGIFLKSDRVKKIEHKFLIVFILISFFALLYADYIFHSFRSVFLGVPSVLIIYWLIHYEKSYSVFYSKILKDIGDSSYSIYLTHIFALAFLRVVFQFNGVNLYEIDPIIFVFISLMRYHALCKQPFKRFAQANMVCITKNFYKKSWI